jgi:glycosyltransferase involved in cell wall biosynthesis
MVRLLAGAGETVHVIGQRWGGAESSRDVSEGGRVVVHRLPFEDPGALLGPGAHPELRELALGLFRSSLPAQAFAWQAALLAERLVEEDGVDVIEAQEYEAPLYFFQVRRALGFGPRRRPPCFLHLHSPTEFVARHNDWDPALPLATTSIRLEEYSIRAADSLLCPSAFLARRVEALYHRDPGSIEVIPLPYGASPRLQRSAETWRHGSVLYVGRLERRKGVLEWIEAAVRIARERPDVRFEFVGANVLGTMELSGHEHVRQRIPDDLRRRFVFHDHCDRGALREHLRRARLTVVPSRWENFPYTCVEAMASGLPVLGSPEGGMKEMIETGRTGWIAASSHPTDLYRAGLDALDCGPNALARMGDDAAHAIRQLCDESRVLDRQLDFRRRVRDEGARASSRLASRPRRSDRRRIVPEAPHSPGAQGVACAVISWGDEARLEETCRSLAGQTRAPSVVLILRATVPGAIPADRPAGASRSRDSWHDRSGCFRDPAEAKNYCVEEILATSKSESDAFPPLGFAFIDAGVRLAPTFVAVGEEVLRLYPNVGLVSGWFWLGTEGKDLIAPPPPAFPHQWLRNDVATFAVVRGQAFRGAGGFRPGLDAGWEHWDLANAVMAAGWEAVTVPEVFGVLPRELNFPGPDCHTPGAMHRRLLERFADLVLDDAVPLALHVPPRDSAGACRPTIAAGQPGPLSLRAALRGAMRDPVRSGWFLLSRLARRGRQAVSRGNARPAADERVTRWDP